MYPIPQDVVDEMNRDPTQSPFGVSSVRSSLEISTRKASRRFKASRELTSEQIYQALDEADMESEKKNKILDLLFGSSKEAEEDWGDSEFEVVLAGTSNDLPHPRYRLFDYTLPEPEVVETVH
jgi:hypothetical protein